MAACTASRKDTEASEEANAEIRELLVTSLVTQKTTLHREYVGDIHALWSVEIYARVKGYLEQIDVDEGQEVKKGQTLFRINDAEYKAELAKARANLKTAIAEAKAAELELNQVRRMVEKAVISKAELEVAKAKYDAVHAGIEDARSALSNASLRLAHTLIKAPFDGVIDRIPLKVGSLIDEGTRLTTVSDIRSVYAYFHVSENEYLEYAKLRMKDTVDSNDQIELQLADGSLYAHKGKIETIEGKFDTGTGSIAFRARLPNPKNLLKHGSTGSIRLANHLTDALIVPQKATFEIQEKSYVFVVDQNNQVKMRSFVPKTRVDHFYVVEAGLKPGEKVVYEVLQSLRDGMKIIPRYIGMDSLTTSAKLLTGHRDRGRQRHCGGKGSVRQDGGRRAVAPGSYFCCHEGDQWSHCSNYPGDVGGMRAGGFYVRPGRRVLPSVFPHASLCHCHFGCQCPYPYPGALRDLAQKHPPRIPKEHLDTTLFQGLQRAIRSFGGSVQLPWLVVAQ